MVNHMKALLTVAITLLASIAFAQADTHTCSQAWNIKGPQSQGRRLHSCQDLQGPKICETCSNGYYTDRTGTKKSIYAYTKNSPTTMSVDIAGDGVHTVDIGLVTLASCSSCT